MLFLLLRDRRAQLSNRHLLRGTRWFVHFGECGSETQGEVVDEKMCRLVVFIRTTGAVDSAVLQPQGEKLLVLINHHQSFTSKNSVFLLRVAAICNHDTLEERSWWLDFFGVHDKTVKLIIECFFFESRGCPGFRDLVKQLSEGSVAPGSYVQRQQEGAE